MTKNKWWMENQFGDVITRTVLQKNLEDKAPRWAASYRFYDDKTDRAVFGTLKKVQAYICKTRNKDKENPIKMLWQITHK